MKAFKTIFFFSSEDLHSGNLLNMNCFSVFYYFVLITDSFENLMKTIGSFSFCTKKNTHTKFCTHLSRYMMSFNHVRLSVCVCV